MALRRMNSEANDLSPHENRESRRYVRLGREASPLLPWVGSPDPTDADMNELFDFGFASAEGGAEQDDENEDLHKSALDEIDMTEVERKLDGAIAGFQAVDTGSAEKTRISSSVWEDGEKFWESSSLPGDVDTPCKPPAPSRVTELRGDCYGSPGRGKDTIFESVVWNERTPRSIQCTPKSLYDSDGFLRT